jgi:protein phosphatase
MGSRAVVIICRDAETAHRRFGVTGGEIGICYTRTGRRFFDDPALEAAFLTRVRDALDATDLWATLRSPWVCLDCELMPWSAKAQELLRRQYAAVGAAAGAAFAATLPVLAGAAAWEEDAAPLLARYEARAAMLGDYVAAYRRYCWPVHALADLKLAPFHLLASEGTVHTDQDHLWHMAHLAPLAQAAPDLLLATAHQVVDVTDPASVDAGIAWWQTLTGRGGEGMVVKPLGFIARGPNGLLQPAVKCRGPEYLRIIYGPEYLAPAHLARLRARGLGRKRSLALREFALGVEALERFVRREPLRRTHECVFGVLALESEPVDPRL